MKKEGSRKSRERSKEERVWVDVEQSKREVEWWSGERRKERGKKKKVGTQLPHSEKRKKANGLFFFLFSNPKNIFQRFSTSAPFATHQSE